ncbi:MAG: FHA domain-containing protein [Deltaproteobacteria bacterium]|nr:FHA domain-containing protein [Deltaproteobacteria bacterium]
MRLPGPFPLSVLLTAAGRMDVLVTRTAHAPGILVGHLPDDEAQAWPARTPRAVFHNPAALAQAELSVDMLCWPLAPRRLMGLVQAVLRVGRGQECDLVVPHSSVSRVHARLFTQRRAAAIADARSTPGTFVNNEPVQELVPRVLKDLDRVRLGAVDLQYVSIARLAAMLSLASPPARSS